MLKVNASDLNRIMHCNGSLFMQPDVILSEQDNTIREEGNAAHWLALTAFTGEFTVEELIDRKAPNGIYITDDIAEHVSDYLSAIDVSPDAARFMGYENIIGNEKWRVNGRADHISVCGNILNIDDFKYGYTIVEPEMNWTLISHALGYITQNYGFIPSVINFTIHQPRAPHRDGRIRTWSIDYNKLLELNSILNNTLSAPTTICQTGPHCYKCPSTRGCVARQDAEMSAIERAHDAFYAEINNDDLSERLDLIDRAMKLLKQSQTAYQELAIHRITKGEVLENYTLEKDQTNRLLVESVTPEMSRVLFGEKSLKIETKSPRQIEQSGIPSDIVNLFTERRSKGKKLVRVSADKRAKRFFK